MEGVVEKLDGVLPNSSLILAHLVKGVVEEPDGVLPDNSRTVEAFGPVN